MKLRQTSLLFLILVSVVGCSSLPPYGQGTYGFFAPDGVAPEVVAGNVFWKIDPPNTRGFRGVFWLERPLIDEFHDDLPGADDLPFMSYNDLEDVAAVQFPKADADFGIFALQTDRSVKNIELSSEDAGTVLETIRVHKHLPPDSEGAAIFRNEIAPHLVGFHTPLNWHHGRGSKNPYWIPAKFHARIP